MGQARAFEGDAAGLVGGRERREAGETRYERRFLGDGVVGGGGSQRW